MQIRKKSSSISAALSSPLSFIILSLISILSQPPILIPPTFHARAYRPARHTSWTSLTLCDKKSPEQILSLQILLQYLSESKTEMNNWEQLVVSVCSCLAAFLGFTALCLQYKCCGDFCLTLVDMQHTLIFNVELAFFSLLLQGFSDNLARKF